MKRLGLMLFFINFIGINAFTEQLYGVITNYSGIVYKSNNNVHLESLKIGSKVEVGEYIVTGWNSDVEVLVNGTTLKIPSLSKVTINRAYINKKNESITSKNLYATKNTKIQKKDKSLEFKIDQSRQDIISYLCKNCHNKDFNKNVQTNNFLSNKLFFAKTLIKSTNLYKTQSSPYSNKKNKNPFEIFFFQKVALAPKDDRGQYRND